MRLRLAIAALAVATASAQAPPHHHSTKHVKTCGEGGMKDPKRPKWNPLPWVYLTCGATKIQSVEFATWGTPEGHCTGAGGTAESFKRGSCHDKGTKAKVEQMCVGKLECKLPAGSAGGRDPASSGVAAFGDPCPDVPKRLAVVISCDAGAWGRTFLITVLLLTMAYLGAGVTYNMKMRGKSWAHDRWGVLPHLAYWKNLRTLVADGTAFTTASYYHYRGIPYEPIQRAQPVATGAVAEQRGKVPAAAGGGSLQRHVASDEPLWSDDESGDDTFDFSKAKAILESALPELEDGMEWETDSEEFE